METRLLKYFLAVASAQSISKASEQLYITQPTLSRQMMDLEQELGVSLFHRRSKGRRLELTEEGLVLKQRAEQILTLMDKTEHELQDFGRTLAGDIAIGAGETPGFELIAKVCSAFCRQYPAVRIHLYSANANDVLEKMENGLLDFGLILGNPDLEGCDYLDLPFADQWGVLLGKDSPYARLPVIEKEQLINMPLIISEQIRSPAAFSGWLSRSLESLHIVCRYNLLYNAAFLAAQNTGAVLCLKGLIPSLLAEKTRFVPLHPPLHCPARFVWRSASTLSRPAAKFLEMLRAHLAKYGTSALHTQTRNKPIF